MIVSTVPWAFCVVGALVFALTSGKVSELGKLTFFAGLLVALLALEHAGAVRLLP